MSTNPFAGVVMEQKSKQHRTSVYIKKNTIQGLTSLIKECGNLHIHCIENGYQLILGEHKFTLLNHLKYSCLSYSHPTHITELTAAPLAQLSYTLFDHPDTPIKIRALSAHGEYWLWKQLGAHKARVESLNSQQQARFLHWQTHQALSLPQEMAADTGAATNKHQRDELFIDSEVMHPLIQLAADHDIVITRGENGIMLNIAGLLIGLEEWVDCSKLSFDNINNLGIGASDMLVKVTELLNADKDFGVTYDIEEQDLLRKTWSASQKSGQHFTVKGKNAQQHRHFLEREILKFTIKERLSSSQLVFDNRNENDPSGSMDMR